MCSSPRPTKQFALKWPTLDPHDLISTFRAENGNRTSEFTYLNEIEAMLDRTGLTHGYLTRPCLNPWDSDCPNLASNYKSAQVSSRV